MASRDLYPQEILQVVLDKSCAKAQSSIPTLAILSVLAGGYIGFGYLAYLKVVSGIPHEWGGFATLLGAAVFPIALICILLGGGELVTSNMMIMSLGRLAGRISSKMLLRNWVIVCMGNLVGTLAMAFFLGYYVGMIEGSVAEKTIAVAEAKVHMDFGRAFVSAVACNWMVCMGAWLHFAAKHTTERMLAIWFPRHDFRIKRLPTPCRQYFRYPCRYFGRREHHMGAIFLQHDSRILGQCRRWRILCRRILSLYL